MRNGVVGTVASWIICSVALAEVSAATLAIDTGRSTLTVLAYKSGLFSVLAHDHVVRAPIASGSLSVDDPLSIELTVRTADLEVLDPGLAAAKRTEVRTSMLSSDVLDAARFPEISFRSMSIVPEGADRWKVTGNLNLHGVTRSVTFSVEGGRMGEGSYRGTVALRQSDFGIPPISVAGGTIKVKDEVRIEFEIVAR